MSQPNLKKALIGLKDYPVQIDPQWQKDTRAFLMEKISSGAPAVGAPVALTGWQILRMLTARFARRASIGATLAVVAIISSVSFVHAANQSLPGDRLYSVKRGLEKVKYNLALKDNKRVQLELKAAQLRVHELSLVVKNYQNTDQRVINEAVNDVQRQISTVKYRLETLAVGDPAKARELARLIDKQADESARALKDVRDEINQSQDSQLGTELGKKVNLALLNIEEAGLQAVSVILDNKGDTNGELEQEVKSNLVKKLENSRASLEQSKNNVQKIENKIRKGLVSLTPVPLDKEIDQAKILVNQKGKEVLDEAQKSLESGDLSEAVSKLAEGNQIVGNIEKKIEKAEAMELDKEKNKDAKRPTIPPGKVWLTPVE